MTEAPPIRGTGAQRYHGPHASAQLRSSPIELSSSVSDSAPVSDVSNHDAGRGVIDVVGLKKVYDAKRFRRSDRIEALRGVTLSVGRGEVFGLLGPNGAGKTTLIKTLLGIIHPSGGEASVLGQPAGSQAARRRIGYLPESLRIDRHHTATSALFYYGRLSGLSDPEIRSRGDELLELVGLKGRHRESVRRFSKGMYQRLGLAQALLHDPDLLILDEPTDGLDPVGRNEVRRVLDRLRTLGKTIFLNSHILQEVEIICDRVAILVKGQVRASGAIDEVVHQIEKGSGTATGNVDLKLRVQTGDASGLDAVDRLRRMAAGTLQNVNTAETTSSNGFRSFDLVGKAVDQGAVDRLVDRLRAEDFSILSLGSQRPTLEQSFMRLVHEAETASGGDTSKHPSSHDGVSRQPMDPAASEPIHAPEGHA